MLNLMFIQQFYSAMDAFYAQARCRIKLIKS